MPGEVKPHHISQSPGCTYPNWRSIFSRILKLAATLLDAVIPRRARRMAVTLRPIRQSLTCYYLLTPIYGLYVVRRHAYYNKLSILRFNQNPTPKKGSSFGTLRGLGWPFSSRT